MNNQIYFSYILPLTLIQLGTLYCFDMPSTYIKSCNFFGFLCGFLIVYSFIGIIQRRCNTFFKYLFYIVLTLGFLSSLTSDISSLIFYDDHSEPFLLMAACFRLFHVLICILMIYLDTKANNKVFWAAYLLVPFILFICTVVNVGIITNRYGLEARELNASRGNMAA